jgi:hypothetical protein
MLCSLSIEAHTMFLKNMGTTKARVCSGWIGVEPTILRLHHSVRSLGATGLVCMGFSFLYHFSMDFWIMTNLNFLSSILFLRLLVRTTPLSPTRPIRILQHITSPKIPPPSFPPMIREIPVSNCRRPARNSPW